MKSPVHILVIALAALVSGLLLLPRYGTTPTASRSTGRLPLADTLGVLGVADVVTVNPEDPFLPAVSERLSTVTAIPASLSADGVTNTTIAVTVRTQEGDLVSGAQVNLESNRGAQDTIEIVRGITGADGQAIFLIRSLEAGTVIFSARAGTKLLDQRATVKFVEAPVTPAAYNARLVWAGVGAILFIILCQYLFARMVMRGRALAVSKSAVSSQL